MKKRKSKYVDIHYIDTDVLYEVEFTTIHWGQWLSNYKLDDLLRPYVNSECFALDMQLTNILLF